MRENLQNSHSCNLREIDESPQHCGKEILKTPIFTCAERNSSKLSVRCMVKETQENSHRDSGTSSFAGAGKRLARCGSLLGLADLLLATSQLNAILEAIIRHQVLAIT